MSKIKYLYIDDENDTSIESLINGFNDCNQILVERLAIERGLSFSTLKNDIIEKIQSREYQGVLIDLRLDGNGPDQLEYSAISISSELRLIAGRKEMLSVPIVLCSTIDNISATYTADKNSQDIFDYTFRKSGSPEYEKFSKKLNSLALGYQFLNSEEKQLNIVFGRTDLNKLDSRIFEKFMNQATVPYDFSNFTIKTLFHSTNPLIKESILAARLGVDIDKSGESWNELKNGIFNNAKYNGLFFDGWDRWWADLVLSKFNEISGKKLSFINAEERVEILNTLTTQKDLVAAKPLKYNVSNEFWTICEGYKKPLDPMEGFRVQTTQELKPWQEPKYLSLDAIIEKIGVDKGLKYHYSEKDRIEELKKKFK